MFILLAVLVAGGGLYAYFTSTKPQPKPLPSYFMLAVSPHAFPLSPGWGRNVTVYVARTPGFQADVNVSLANGPSWIYYQPTVIHSSETNATMYVAITGSAPKVTVQFNVEARGVGSANQLADLTMRVVGVRNVTGDAGTAAVYETTKVLDDVSMAALKSYDNSTGVIQFFQVTAMLESVQLGDVLVGPPHISTVARNGFLRTVLSTQQSSGGLTIGTEQTGILELFRTANIHKPFRLPSSSGSAVGGLGVRSLNPQDWDLGNGYKLSATISFDLSGSHADISVKDIVKDACLTALGAGGLPAGAVCLLIGSAVGGLDYFDLLLQGQVTIDVTFTGPGGPVNWGPVDIIPLWGGDVVPLFPPFLWLSVDGAVEASLNGNLHKTDVEVTGTINVGPIGPHCCGWTLESGGNVNFQQKSTVGLEAGDSLRGEIGPRIDVSIDSGVLGGSLAFHGFLELKSGIGWPIGKPFIILPTANTKVDLSNVNSAFGTGFAVGVWKALPATFPGLTNQFSCVWTDDKLGKIGHSDQGSCNFDHADIPTSQFFTGPAGVHHITVTSTYTNLPPFELDAGVDTTETINIGWGAWTGRFGPQDLFSNQIWSGGAGGSTKLGPSDPVAVTFLLPTPTLEILGPTQSSCPTGQSHCSVDSIAAVYAGTPFNLDASARVWTGQGYEDLCQAQKNRLEWIAGNNAISYAASLGYYVTAQLISKGCGAPYNPGKTGPLTLTFVYMAATNTGEDLVAVDNNGNPIYIAMNFNVQPKPATPPPMLHINPVVGTYSAYGQPPGTNPLVFIAGDIHDGTPPYEILYILNSARVPDGHWLITSQTAVKGPVVAYTWDLRTNFCNLPLFSGFAIDTVTVTVSAKDHNNLGATANTGKFTIGCQHPAQSFPPILSSGLVTLLTVLFAVTAKRKRATLFGKIPWLRIFQSEEVKG